ncbi:MAG TPA: hypothetical protein VF407_16250 [Polyangiaceae bacterium]
MSIALVVGAVIAPIAGLMAFAVAYGEYAKHFPERRKPLLLALRSGFFAFAFFSALAVAIGFALPFLVGAP